MTRSMPPLTAMRLDSVRRYFPSDAAVADALRVSRNRLERWRAGQAPDPVNERTLLALDVVVSLLTGYLV